MEATPPGKPVPGTKEPLPAPPVAADATPLAPPGVTGGAATGQEKAGIIYLPQPQPGATPKQIPEKIAEAPRPAPPADKSTTPADAAAAAPKAGQAQVFRDQQSAIRSQGSGLFDTKGFPMGDYATLVIERVNSNWFIPSYLRNSRGSTTIVFYIARDGHFLDARIVVPSGSNPLDLAALSAIVGSNPFPPLPEGFPADRVGAKFVFSYNERQ
jgi:TonB family protein